MAANTRAFFTDFPDFKSNPDASVSDEFNRLANYRKWKTGSKTWRKMWNRCMALEYDRLLGQNLSGLQNWQQLCEELDLKGPFTSIKQCKKALSKIYVNIVDLLDCRILKKKPTKFPNLRALEKYTRESGRVFSRHLAKQDKLLRVLLRKLW
ncbi:hypothetical protein ALT_3592 [Aspergillus lentulus]|uniref:Uncharacterized protein n=1 Tax=Aspergillus lentulus TaxID=293939 RepID=A0AAN4PH36_ASPLE|nr:uncharacterized protein IFM58399_02059 [Aspergillus lentulus]GAQ06271.1 hypothetical protein ALT_3592 [Aspergillus lentulus]GFF28692.1 hypothetical protein IFM58399_02059 [Aspergillus lentulus]GFF49484.1 hypothetical protein IFM62136_01290 [Aspergillus lentulus]GFF67205.1 hypothetical protein IFM47457_01640 [Aspergillus lentulus]GFF67366.1 hypothetical protein IFM60648_02239 [Aspergillus lentulus]